MTYMVMTVYDEALKVYRIISTKTDKNGNEYFWNGECWVGMEFTERFTEGL